MGHGPPTQGTLAHCCAAAYHCKTQFFAEDKNLRNYLFNYIIMFIAFLSLHIYFLLVSAFIFYFGHGSHLQFEIRTLFKEF
jgi:hypothetical protein